MVWERGPWIPPREIRALWEGNNLHIRKKFAELRDLSSVSMTFGKRSYKPRCFKIALSVNSKA